MASSGSYLQSPVSIKFIPAASTANTTNTISILDSGSIFYVGAITGAGFARTIQLPAARQGLWYKFVFQTSGTGVAANTTNIVSTTTNMTSNLMGLVTAYAGTHNAGQTGLQRSATAANAVAGDYVECYSDGLVWYANAFSFGAASSFTTVA